MLAGGHYLNSFIRDHFQFELTDHLEIIVLVIVLITTAPVIIKLAFGKKKAG
jgi:membrane-associated protein